jgi:hypothetical protein
MKPACMSPDEYAAWQEVNAQLRGRDKVGSPCRDCTPLWHRDMVAGGMCDGVPGETGRVRLPSELAHLTYAELRQLRKSLPYFAPPPELVLAMERARWREYQQRRRDMVSAVAGGE